jgi:hypothetical protein
MNDATKKRVLADSQHASCGADCLGGVFLAKYKA